VTMRASKTIFSASFSHHTYTFVTQLYNFGADISTGRPKTTADNERDANNYCLTKHRSNVAICLICRPIYTSE